MNGKFGAIDFYIDSVGNMHMTPNKKLLPNRRSYEISQMTVTNTKLVSVEGCGEMNFKTAVNNFFLIAAKKDLCTPKLSTHLL